MYAEFIFVFKMKEYKMIKNNSLIIKSIFATSLIAMLSGCSGPEGAYKEMTISKICKNHIMNEGRYLDAQEFSDTHHEKKRIIDSYMRNLIKEGDENEIKNFIFFTESYEKSLKEMSKDEIEDFYDDNC